MATPEDKDRPLQKWDAGYRSPITRLGFDSSPDGPPKWSAYYDSTGTRTDIQELYRETVARAEQIQATQPITTGFEAGHQDLNFTGMQPFADDSDEGSEARVLQGEVTQATKPTIT